MRVSFLLCLIFFFLLSPVSKSLAQVDSLLQRIAESPDSLHPPLYVDLLHAIGTEAGDTFGLTYAYEGVKLAEQFADTLNLQRILWSLNKKLDALGDSLAADSIWIYRQELMSLYGFEIQSEFSNQMNNLDYNSFYQEIRVFVDSTGRLSHDSAISPAYQSRYSLNQSFEADLNPAFAYWVSIRLRGDKQQTRKGLFMPNNPNGLWDSVQLYLPDRFGSVEQLLAGQAVDIDDKPTKNWLDLFEIPIPANADFVVFFRLKGFGGGLIPPWVYLSQVNDTYLERDGISVRNMQIFLGIFLFQLLFFGLLYLATRDREFAPYLLYLLGVVLFAISALWIRHWLPKSEEIVPILTYMACSWISGLGLLRFSERFLNIRELLPKWSKISRFFLIIFILVPLALLLTLVFHTYIMQLSRLTIQSILNNILKLYIFLFSAELILLTVMSILALRRGYSPALYYLIALAFLLGSIGVISLIPLFGLFFIIEYESAILISQSGLILQSCFFALGIGHKRRLLEKEKLLAQKTLNEELSKVNSAFGRFVPHTFLKAIGRESVLDIELGDGVEKEVTVFFSDIRDYTTLSENMTPHENFRFLNSYLGRLGPVISDHKGFVNQYYGDGIMAIFMNSPADAIEAAIRTQYTLRVYNEDRLAKGRMPIQIGLGLHAGPLMMGVIGDTLRMEAGVVSDTVNSAARMEGLTKHFGCTLVVSEKVIEDAAVKDQFHYRLLGKVQVKGKKDPIIVYDCFEGDDPFIMEQKLHALEPFEIGMKAYYQQDFITAAKSFDRSLERYPADKAAQKYLYLCHEYIANGVPESWNGVEALQKK
ncbi:MAG: adenylate/guanylate cyclase domain-containing protein [Bacteroidota bacterium]